LLGAPDFHPSKSKAICWGPRYWRKATQAFVVSIYAFAGNALVPAYRWLLKIYCFCRQFAVTKNYIRILFSATFLPGITLAQAIHAPVLHHRDEPERGLQTVTEVHGQPVLSDDVSGEYLLGEPGEVIEIILERQGHLTGYISVFGNHDSDRGTPLTFLFHHTSVSGEQIRFETVTVHGVWYGFAGSIRRGEAKTRAEEGFYRLSGTLEEHDTAGGTVQKRNVDLKLSRSAS
jgi:hypothetical protein